MRPRHTRTSTPSAYHRTSPLDPRLLQTIAVNRRRPPPPLPSLPFPHFPSCTALPPPHRPRRRSVPLSLAAHLCLLAHALLPLCKSSPNSSALPPPSSSRLTSAPRHPRTFPSSILVSRPPHNNHSSNSNRNNSSLLAPRPPLSRNDRGSRRPTHRAQTALHPTP